MVDFLVSTLIIMVGIYLFHDDGFAKDVADGREACYSSGYTSYDTWRDACSNKEVDVAYLEWQAK